jgi:hypothetical protein
MHKAGQASSGSCDSVKTTAVLLAWIENSCYHFILKRKSPKAISGSHLKRSFCHFICQGETLEAVQEPSAHLALAFVFDFNDTAMFKGESLVKA